MNKKPCYTKLVTHTLRGGGKVTAKAGTQKNAIREGPLDMHEFHSKFDEACCGSSLRPMVVLAASD